jgi:hypothetical protein
MEKSKRALARTQENEVVPMKISAPMQSTSVSLTTAICHFLDQGLFSIDFLH